AVVWLRLETVKRCGANAKICCDLGERRPRPNPKLANLWVREKLITVTACALAKEQGRLVRCARFTVRCIFGQWIEHEHRTRLAVTTPTGEVSKRAVRSIRVEGVV